MGRLERAEQRLEKRYTHDVVTILRHLTGPPRSPTEGRVRRRPGCVHVQNVKRPRTASSSRQRLMWRSLNVVFAGQATSFVSAPGSRCVRSSFSMHPTVRRQGSARHGRRGHWYERRRRRRLDTVCAAVAPRRNSAVACAMLGRACAPLNGARMACLLMLA